jgi:hypothetical protein
MITLASTTTCPPTATGCDISSPFQFGIPTLANHLFNVFYFVVGLVFIVLIIFSGIKIITAGGNKEAIDEAKKTLTAGVIGLIIVLLAGVIVRLLGSLIPGFSNLLIL